MKGIKEFKGKYVAYISSGHEQLYVGYYSNIEEAVKARDDKIVELSLNYASLNRPERYGPQLKKLCQRCNLVKNIDDFISPRKKIRYRYCSLCRHKKISKSIDSTEYRNKGLKQYIGSRLSNIKRRCKLSGREFCLTRDFVMQAWNEQEGKCGLCGIEMTHEAGKGLVKTVLSLDRKDSSKGYTENNVWLTCDRCNRLKQSLTPRELVELCQKIISHCGSKFLSTTNF
jgi:5-methylcytosine-specific restriction endonuclease McrA